MICLLKGRQGIPGTHGIQCIHGYTRYTWVYRVYKVYVGIHRYTGYTGYTWVYRVYRVYNNNNNNKFIQYYHFVQVLPIKITIINS